MFYKFYLQGSPRERRGWSLLSKAQVYFNQKLWKSHKIFDFFIVLDYFFSLITLPQHCFLWHNRTDTETAAAAAIAPFHVVWTDNQEVSGHRTTRVKWTTPAVTVDPRIVQIRTIAVARSRQENRIAIRTSYGVTVYAVFGSPCPSAFCAEFVLFFFGWHTPSTTPIYMSSIIF